MEAQCISVWTTVEKPTRARTRMHKRQGFSFVLRATTRRRNAIPTRRRPKPSSPNVEARERHAQRRRSAFPLHSHSRIQRLLPPQAARVGGRVAHARDARGRELLDAGVGAVDGEGRDGGARGGRGHARGGEGEEVVLQHGGDGVVCNRGGGAVEEGVAGWELSSAGSRSSEQGEESAGATHGTSMPCKPGGTANRYPYVSLPYARAR